MKFLLPFFLFAFTLPGAAQTLSGRLVKSGNIEQPIRRSTVQLTDTATGEVRVASVNPFGYFRFPGIVFGRRYDLEVRSKQYSFGMSSGTTFSDNFGVLLLGFKSSDFPKSANEN